MYILAIETSCDETAVAIYHKVDGLLVHKIYSQIKMHQKYAGVVPELASRDHVRVLLPLVKETLKEIDINLKYLSAIGYTLGPGLIGALMVGAMFAKTLAMSLSIPSLGIHHIEGHLLAPMLDDKPPSFPHVALIVSGGHTMLAKITGLGSYEIIGEGIDDAAGEAFDKTGKLLGLPYPGGPAISKLAESGEKGRFKFPRPLTGQPGLNFSFSGLKTYTANTCMKHPDDLQTKADIALAFEDAVIDTLIIKCKRALKETGYKTIVISGGVSANKSLRKTFDEYGKKHNIDIYYPKLEFCTDNAAMIAYAAFYRLEQGQKDLTLELSPKPRWPLEEL